jgi:hypothetical protein
MPANAGIHDYVSRRVPWPPPLSPPSPQHQVLKVLNFYFQKRSAVDLQARPATPDSIPGLIRNFANARAHFVSCAVSNRI